MDEEIQNNQEDSSKDEIPELGSTPMGPAPEPIRIPDPNEEEKPIPVPGPSIRDAQERLVQEIAKDTNVQQKVRGSENAFIDFAAEKSIDVSGELTPIAKKLAGVSEKKDAIRTYHSDAAETIQNQKLSLTNIAVAESRRRTQETKSVPEKKEGGSGVFKRILLNILSALVFSAAVGIFAFLYLDYQEQRALPETVGPIATLALANRSVSLDVSGMNRELLLERFKTLADSAEATIGDVTNVTLETGMPPQQITTPMLLEMLEAASDPALLRSLEDEFMLGLHSFDKEYYFLIIKTTFFENAFAGMLRWENTIATELPFLVRDITPPITFPVSSSTSTASSTQTTATGTAPTTSQEPSPIFEDQIIKNKDVRVHFGSDDEIDILYTFIDPETLIITSNPETMRAVLDRLTVARFRQ